MSAKASLIPNKFIAGLASLFLTLAGGQAIASFGPPDNHTLVRVASFAIGAIAWLLGVIFALNWSNDTNEKEYRRRLMRVAVLTLLGLIVIIPTYAVVYGQCTVVTPYTQERIWKGFVLTDYGKKLRKEYPGISDTDMVRHTSEKKAAILWTEASRVGCQFTLWISFLVFLVIIVFPIVTTSYALSSIEKLVEKPSSLAE